MNQVKVNNQKLWSVALIFLGWTLYGLFFASQSYVRQAYFGRNPDWQNNLAIWLTCGYSWALLTPPILFLARRFSFNRVNWLRTFAIHIPLAVVFSITALAVFFGFRILFGENYSLAKFQNLVVDEIHSCILVYFGILGVNSALAYLFKSADGDTRKLKLTRTAISNNAELNREFPSLYETPETKNPGPEPSVYAERFTVKGYGRIVLVNVSEIDRITSEGNYVKLHTNCKSHLLRETMKAMEQKLDPKVFLRVRRSTIVRIKQIKELHPLFNGEFEIILENGTKISSSRRYRKNLDAMLKT